MILVVPKYIDGLADVEKQITDEKLRSMCDNLDRSGEDEVEVIMPKFDLETTTDLKDTLEKLGVKRIFDPTGFITEMSYQPLSIGAAVHKGLCHIIWTILYGPYDIRRRLVYKNIFS